ncbi:WD40 repeat domain-containing protein [Streptosporangium canum]|uniref:WD40 repeat domain-containing protein n=1 Tax=Streptosporangium canum TaxID=324952 RepID=UPI00341ECD7F
MIVATILLACASCSAEKPVPLRTAAPITQAATPQAKPPIQSDPKGHIDVTEVAIGEVKGRKVVLSAGREGLVQIRDATTLRPIGKPIPGLAPIEYTVLDGVPLVLVATRQGTVEAWDLRSRTRRGPALAAGEDVRALTAYEGIAVTWSEEGVKSFDVTSGRLRHRIWDWTSGEWLRVADVQGVPVLLAGTSEFLLSYDLRTGRARGGELEFSDEMGERDDTPPSFEDLEVATIGGHSVVLMPTDRYGVRVYDLVTRSFLPWIEQRHYGRSDADDTALATHRGTTVMLSVEETPRSDDRDLEGGAEIVAWNPENGQTVTSFRVGGPVSTVAAEGGLVVTGGPDNAVRSFDLASGREQAVVHGSDVDRALGMAVDGTIGIADDGSGWQAWDLTTYSRIGTRVLTPHYLTSVAIGRHRGRRIVVTGHGEEDPSVRIWDLANRKELRSPLTGFRAGVSQPAVARLGGRTLIVAAGDGKAYDEDDHDFDDPRAESTLRVWDLESRSPVHSPMRIGKRQITGLGLAKVNGRPVAVTLSEGFVQVFDLEAGRRVNGWAVSGFPQALATGTWRGIPVMAIAAGKQLLVRNVATGADLIPPVKLNSSVTSRTLAMRGHMLVVDDQRADQTSRVIVDMATRRVVTSF